jgi:hypothetical protein
MSPFSGCYWQFDALLSGIYTCQFYYLHSDFILLQQDSVTNNCIGSFPQHVKVTVCCLLLRKHERQCTYSSLLRRVRRTILAMVKQLNITCSECVCVCVCSLSYPAFKVHAPILLSSVTFPTLPYFSSYSHKIYNFWKKVFDIKRVLILLTTFISNISHYKKNSAGCYKYTQVFMWSSRHFSQILINLEFSWQIL